MATIDETIYENPQNGTISQVQSTTKQSLKTDKEFQKRAALLGGAILSGGAVGGGVAYAVKGDDVSSSAATEENVLQVIEEDDSKSFKEAFNDAREQVGPGGVFRWHGKVYNTYTEEEWKNMSDEEKAAFNERVQPVLTDNERNADYGHSMGHHHDHDHDHNISRTQTEHITKVVHTEEYVIGEEKVTNFQGRDVIAASGTHDGKQVLLIDIDRDGVYDAAIEDYNNNGTIDDNEITDISSKGVTVHDKSLIGATPVSNTFSIHQEEIIEVNGTEIIAAKASYNGREVVLVDVNRDGYYDGALMDTNNDGKVEENEIVDISDQRITVNDRSLIDPNASTNTHIASNETPVVTIEEEERGLIGDNEVIAAKGTVDGKDAFIVDVNRDGTYDVALVDTNNNGQLDDGDERVNVVSANAQVHDRSLVDSNAFDASKDIAEDNVPDYVNTLASADNNSSDVVVAVDDDTNLASTDDVVVEIDEQPTTENDVAVVEVDETESVVEVEVTPDPDTDVAQVGTSTIPEDTQYDEAADYYNNVAYNADATQDTSVDMVDDYGTI